jgi:hypothetical protein
MLVALDSKFSARVHFSLKEKETRHRTGSGLEKRSRQVGDESNHALRVPCSNFSSNSGLYRQASFKPGGNDKGDELLCDDIWHIYWRRL